MGFKPQGMPTAFNKTNGQGAQQKQSVKDLLVTIDSYDLGQSQMNCTGTDGSKMMVTIRPETIARNIRRSKELEATANRPKTQSWEGYLIDQRMADHLPSGHKIVVERATRIRSLNHNGATAYVMQSDRIINVADQAPHKTFEGLFSISTFQNHIFHVQHWWQDKDGIEKGFLVDDTASIEMIRKQLDEDSAAFLNKELRPHHGVQFRVVLPPATPEDKCSVIDVSPCFDWVSRQTDASGAEIAPGHPLDGQKFMSLLFDQNEGYIPAYVDHKFPLEQYPGRFVEVCFYTNYRAGPRSRYMVIPDRTFDPIYRLAFTQTKLAIDDEEFVQGKNVAVKGVLQIASDQADLQTRTFKTRNIAVRLHANGIIGHVHAWIRDHQGRKTQPHEALRQVPVNRAAPGEKAPAQEFPQQNYAPAPQAPAQNYSAPAQNYAPPAQAPVPAAPASALDNQNPFDDWDEFDDDPFAPDAGGARQHLDAARKNLGDDE